MLPEPIHQEESAEPEPPLSGIAFAKVSYEGAGIELPYTFL